ncbi:MAG: nuclear transport factor 2 family protein [Verrucomicrobia bacterium]|nr:nuclear transport factor 2 family protein [Verrucomicrobiota bacterium]
MKPSKVLVLVLLTIGLIGFYRSLTRAATTSSETKTIEPIDIKAQAISDIKAVEDRFLTAFRAKDVNAIMELCIPDESLVVFDVTPPLQRTGAQAYRKDWEEAFNRFEGPLQAEISEEDVTVGGDVAYVSSIHHVTGTMKGGKKVDYTVRVTDGLKKTNGKWLIAHTHVSFPVDMRTGQADMQSKP